MSLPSRLSAWVDGSSSPGIAGSGICFTQTTTCMVGSLREEGDGPFWQGSRTPVETATFGRGAPASVPFRGVPAELQPDLDVLVVGTGPAGVAAALTAHRRGLHVALRRPGHVPSRQDLRRRPHRGRAAAPRDPRRTRAGARDRRSPSRRSCCADPFGRVIELPLPVDGHHAVVTTRLDLDAALVDRAAAAGVPVHEGRAVTGAEVDAARRHP